ncbi:hypothetical protein PHYSODRAFT_342506 [Phytophthora sojae]|uniref:Protein kinase domain-containing protein n=1 Tax=Phytophthora sojae (strain P6497) TaxID=1094619 RepID=G5AGT4_PHYSP|nr:hypothetical protein PHYSODRAFT_342506 [Phytophthora sojae]EGZ05364.1 hypothetical protein PHYSODRAFT_342506 [Phytophthora sojae]|eukprot:XP_009539285.1 hypothetical protein PHYSODRAFT_342506 [Phytophthora sojae]
MPRNPTPYGSVHRGSWTKGAAAAPRWTSEELKLYGACHVSSPAFFMCDDATHGSFSDFLEEDAGRAALGLGYLHAEKVVHGDLKCTNLLVGNDYKAMRLWLLAPECLVPPNEEANPQFNPRFASDVYSLGMCIVEAFQGEAPYGLLDDDEIMTRLFELEPYPRPGNMQDDEWALVERMVQPDWRKRLSLQDAIDGLKTAFAGTAAIAWTQIQHSRENMLQEAACTRHSASRPKLLIVIHVDTADVANKGFIRRLTSNRKVVEGILEFLLRMDDLFKLLNLTHVAEMSKWKHAMKEEIHRTGNKIKEGIAQLVVVLRCTHGEAGPEVGLLAKTFNNDDVDFDLQECFDLGSYGSVHHGTWGKGTNVVIKCLLAEDQDEKASDSFYTEAALGLFYLHSQKVVHGDLKCSNIVIGADRRAKLCDFGFSIIRAQSAPECLLPVDESPNSVFNPRFAHDVNSFGMCIVEAFLGHPPYELEAETVMERKLNNEVYPRVVGMSDKEWTFVERLLDPDWETRMSLADAIDTLMMFAD